LPAGAEVTGTRDIDGDISSRQSLDGKTLARASYLYTERGYSLREVAAVLHCHAETLRRAFKRLGIPLRSKAQAQAARQLVVRREMQSELRRLTGGTR
jgi:hypothetical protein